MYSIDLAIFYFFNHTISTGFLDKFFSIITNVSNWYIAYILLAGIAVIKGGRKGRIVVIGLIILIIICDQTGYRILKEFFQRLRPCDILTDVILPVGCTGTYSFPSNHALNNFATAVFVTRFYPNLKLVFFITASLVSISRVYLGLHYPSDILGGAIIGATFGYLFSLAVVKIDSGISKMEKLSG
ncbi:MAG TPA: phosphatase PAP2 family protein [Ignavibacteriaceae bacterium]